jgi:hypothetical protein
MAGGSNLQQYPQSYYTLDEYFALEKASELAGLGVTLTLGEIYRDVATGQSDTKVPE